MRFLAHSFPTAITRFHTSFKMWNSLNPNWNLLEYFWESQPEKATLSQPISTTGIWKWMWCETVAFKGNRHIPERKAAWLNQTMWPELLQDAADGRSLLTLPGSPVIGPEGLSATSHCWHVYIYIFKTTWGIFLVTVTTSLSAAFLSWSFNSVFNLKE